MTWGYVVMKNDAEKFAAPNPADARMRITTTQAMFAWGALEDSPSLQTVREFLAAVPDAKTPGLPAATARPRTQ